MKKRQLRGFDLRQIKDCHGLVGVDEAGRGALAGPVAAGAVLINRSFLDSDWCRRHAKQINDSKQLTAEQRDDIYARMEWLLSEHRIIFASGTSSVAEIERENILGATRLAMRRAIEAALKLGQIYPHPPDPLFNLHDPVVLEPGQCVTDWQVVVDGRPIKGLGFAHRGVVGGDARSLAIAMASIVAKVTRDRLMKKLEAEAPGYGFARHKGYATAVHREALEEQGPSPHHRGLFVRTFLKREVDVRQTVFDFATPEEEGDSAQMPAASLETAALRA